MKNVKLIAVIVITLLVFNIYAATRAQLYRKFGPMLIEAIVLVIKDEINILRAQHSLAERTNQQLVDAIETKLADVNEYDWMKD